jgi:hypothetical protein
MASGACLGSTASPANDTGLDGSVPLGPDAAEAQAPAPADSQGDAGASPFTEAALRDAASAFNAKYCPAFERCDPGLFEFTFGASDAGGAACAAAGGLVAIPASRVRFVDDPTAPYGYGSRLTPDLLRACADALDFSSCEDWVRFSSERAVPDACRPAFFGSLDGGAPCGAWNQCASGRCLQEVSAAEGACGSCVPPVDPHFGDVGDSCAPNAPGPPDVRASASPCHDYLVCNPVTSKCETPAANGDCDPAVGCSLVPHFRYCDPGTKKCTPAPFAAATERCGPVDGSPLGFVSCAKGFACTRDGASNLVCAKVAADGEACTFTPDYESHCKEPGSVCFRDVCRPNGPAQCTAPEVPP